LVGEVRAEGVGVEEASGGDAIYNAVAKTNKQIDRVCDWGE
jgi:hypothetical protein